MTKCDNCENKIGKLETVYIYKEKNNFCNNCYKKICSNTENTENNNKLASAFSEHICSVKNFKLIKWLFIIAFLIWLWLYLVLFICPHLPLAT